MHLKIKHNSDSYLWDALHQRYCCIYWYIQGMTTIWLGCQRQSFVAMNGCQKFKRCTQFPVFRRARCPTGNTKLWRHLRGRCSVFARSTHEWEFHEPENESCNTGKVAVTFHLSSYIYIYIWHICLFIVSNRSRVKREPFETAFSSSGNEQSPFSWNHSTFVRSWRLTPKRDGFWPQQQQQQQQQSKQSQYQLGWLFFIIRSSAPVCTTITTAHRPEWGRRHVRWRRTHCYHWSQ